MIQTFIEQNRRLLKFYYIATRIIGWLIMLLGIMVFLGFINTQGQIGWSQLISAKWFVKIFQRSGIFIICTGLLSLGAAQLIRYLFDSESQPGWTLRHGSKILYVFAFLVFWHAIFIVMLYFPTSDIPNPFLRLFQVLPTLLSVAAKLLALIGFAQSLKRIMPMIEESRTLV